MTSKIEGWTNRQKDTDWGYAFAHLIPFVGIYYAITRRTITPILYNLIGSFAIGLCFGVFYAAINPNVKDKDLETGGSILGLISTPLLIKNGIEKARKYGEGKLESN